MGSDIQSLAIPAKGYDSSTGHTAGLTSLEIMCIRSRSRSNLALRTLHALASCTRSLRDVSCIGFKLNGSKGAVIA